MPASAPTSRLPDFDGRTAFFGKRHFAYDADARCLPLPRRPDAALSHSTSDTERVRVYQAPAGTCNACPLKARCTDSANGRQVQRSFDETYLDRVRGYHATEAYQKAMRKRKVWVEPLFAEAKDWHGLRRFRLRGLAKVNMEAQLIAAGQNLKRLLSWRGWGRRPFPSGATGVALPTLLPLPVPLP